MKIEILGTGCARCKTLAEHVEAAARKLGLTYEIVKITEIEKILGYGVMTTPSLVVDGKVVLSGKVPSESQLMAMLTTMRQGEGR